MSHALDCGLHCGLSVCDCNASKEDGSFLCADHLPAKSHRQYWVDAQEIECKCDHCDKRAAFYVLAEPTPPAS